jgi:hypothetical protein
MWTSERKSGPSLRTRLSRPRTRTFSPPRRTIGRALWNNLAGQWNNSQWTSQPRSQWPSQSHKKPIG